MFKVKVGNKNKYHLNIHEAFINHRCCVTSNSYYPKTKFSIERLTLNKGVIT